MPMNTPHKCTFLSAIAVAIGLSTPSAQAGYIVTLEQVGPNVVAMGSGPIDLTDLTIDVGSFAQPSLNPSVAQIVTGPPPLPAVVFYKGFSGPASFGPPGGMPILANSGSGDDVGIIGATGVVRLTSSLIVPSGYVSDNPLSDTATYDNTTITGLGATPGTYVWTWGSGAHADSFTLQIGPAAVPAPLIGHGLPVLLAVGGLLFGAKLLKRGRRRRLQFG
jgi:hypothetical protein